MKRIVECETGSGFESVLGEKITLYCGIYIYTGRLVGVNNDHLELEEPKLVYETGCLDEGDWKDAQDLLSPHRVMIRSIESWGPVKC